MKLLLVITAVIAAVGGIAATLAGVLHELAKRGTGRAVYKR